MRVFVLFFVKSDVEDTLKRIQSHRGVTGVIIADQQGENYILKGFKA